jgi:uncharacterized BrkB/YihY/UPF0761 family membrane protein
MRSRVLVLVAVLVMVLVLVLVAVAVLTAHLLFSLDNFSNATLGHAHLSLYIVVVTFYFLFTLDCYNFSTSHQPIGVKINLSVQ